MGKAKSRAATKYTPQELRAASNRVMRSLNTVNKQAMKNTGFKPQITNSLGKERSISKSSVRRQNRKQKSNLAGKSMDSLLEVLPETEDQPQIGVDKKKVLNPHKMKSNQRLAQVESKRFTKVVGTSMAEIRRKLLEQKDEIK
ncbi:hypothetical protein B9G98_00051 [Wickerhamiella sorbophila]|uniref:Ribosome biogenesis protein SLX9 n=1 Tax=Wickerhamiella sorbophila TaxID=45607 RepID=A0A2T0FBT1_9ASCO|nr:hypothetical protein B9G98_00051 [Wickerhamiella sorbophila]PRT52431.1 hypothetical protein B9G98_00051 [Wickerhamiella sorbophila]